jgi:superfamily I DNA/RNA helicase
MNRVGVDLQSSDALKDAFDTFFRKVESRITDADGGMASDVGGFRRLFSHPSGVVVSTCHGVKGEEYDTVIAFGLLRGYVPNWDSIINESEQVALERESKLLYVICSRAKRRLHLIAETGRTTRTGRAYETARLLSRVRFNFDHVNENNAGEHLRA